MKFILEIELSNDARLGDYDYGTLSRIFQQMMRQMDTLDNGGKMPEAGATGVAGYIDAKAVGKWEVVEIDVCMAGNPAVNGICGNALCVCAPQGQIVEHNGVACHTNEQLAVNERRDHNFCSTCEGWFKPVPRRSRAERVQGNIAVIGDVPAGLTQAIQKVVAGKPEPKGDHERMSTTLEIKTKHGQTMRVNAPPVHVQNHPARGLFAAWGIWCGRQAECTAQESDWNGVLSAATAALQGIINRRDYATDVRAV